MHQPEEGRVFWKTATEDCDGQDKDVLKLYRRKRTEWIDWLHGDDEHSIQSQILDMSENYLAYRMINESRRLAIQRGEPSAALNPLLAQFINNAFYTAQGLAIRRLTDRKETKPDRQVISIRRLLDDVKEHGAVFTREVYVGFDGTPFDPEPARIRWQQKEEIEREKKIAEHGGGFFGWVDRIPESGPEAWEKAGNRHLVFDKLAGKSPQQRDRHDRISPKIFIRLDHKIEGDAVKHMRTRCNKRIAHAADATSRQAIEHEPGISFDAVDAAHRSLVTTAQFISRDLLDAEPISPAASNSFDLFEQLDAPWLTTSDKAELNQCWLDLVSERERWAWQEAHSHILGNAAKL